MCNIETNYLLQPRVICSFRQPCTTQVKSINVCVQVLPVDHPTSTQLNGTLKEEKRVKATLAGKKKIDPK